MCFIFFLSNFLAYSFSTNTSTVTVVYDSLFFPKNLAISSLICTILSVDLSYSTLSFRLRLKKGSIPFDVTAIWHNASRLGKTGRFGKTPFDPT